jgi:hypothetical protein
VALDAPVEKNKLDALGVYIFAGGFTLGVSQHFNVVAHLEGGDYGVMTAKNFWPKMPIWQSVPTWPLKRFAGVPFVYANPPCAIWSVAGSSMNKGKAQWVSDPRTNCIRNVFKVLREVRPKILVWESVTQAWTRGRGLVEQLAKEALAQGYAVTYLFTSAELHGIPQPRQRFLMWCHRVALDLPMPTTVYRNVADVLGLDMLTGAQDVPVWGEHRMSEDTYRLARATRMDELVKDAYLDIDPDGERPPAFMLRRVSAFGRGTTFTSAIMELHPYWNRFLANSEIAALGGWPYREEDKDYYHGDDQLVRAQLCQAVLPPVGEYVGPDEACEPALRLVNHIVDERPYLKL